MRAVAGANKDRFLRCVVFADTEFEGQIRKFLDILILPRSGNETLFLFEIAPCYKNVEAEI